METTFTQEYFRSEGRSFYDLMGTRAFWELPEENREGAWKGVLHCYLRAPGLDHTDEIFLQMLMTHFGKCTIYRHAALARLDNEG